MSPASDFACIIGKDYLSVDIVLDFHRSPQSVPLMKYIRHKQLGFILFEGGIAHADVARRFGGAHEVVSAGFVFAPQLDAKCLGHSGTLNLGIAPTDSDDLKSRMKAF
jgi:hypothetical protein